MDQHTENHITNCTDVYKLSRPTVIIIQCWYICLSEICGQNLKNVGQNSCCNDITSIHWTQRLLPTYLRFWPHFSERPPRLPRPVCCIESLEVECIWWKTQVRRDMDTFTLDSCSPRRWPRNMLRVVKRRKWNILHFCVLFPGRYYLAFTNKS